MVQIWLIYQFETDKFFCYSSRWIPSLSLSLAKFWKVCARKLSSFSSQLHSSPSKGRKTESGRKSFHRSTSSSATGTKNRGESLEHGCSIATADYTRTCFVTQLSRQLSTCCRFRRFRFRFRPRQSEWLPRHSPNDVQRWRFADVSARECIIMHDAGTDWQVESQVITWP
jgi:hypothetical protein